MAFDRESGRIIVLVTWPGAWETWAFDVCTNTWDRMRPNRHPGSGNGAIGWIQLVYDADSNLTIGTFPDGKVWAYDDEADTWTEHGAAPVMEPLRLVYDPVSGLVFVQAIEGLIPRLWTFDVESDTWTSIPQIDAPSLGQDPDHGLLAYDGSVDRVIAYNGLSYGTRLLDLRTGTWSTAAAVTPLVNTGFFASGGEIAYDEAGEQTVVFSDGLAIAYDAGSDRWLVLDGRLWTGQNFPTGPTARMGHWMVYDSTNARLVVYGSAYRTNVGWVQADDVLGFDPATREWTVLLEASDVQPIAP
jgi:phage baseplate assembly protein gpV